jgi:hypothetical protein
MYALPPCQALVYRLDAKSHSVPRPEELGMELHFEERPDISILNDFRATQVSYAVTGALVAGQKYANPAMVPDPELIATANRILERWFRDYQRSRSSIGRT